MPKSLAPKAAASRHHLRQRRGSSLDEIERERRYVCSLQQIEGRLADSSLEYRHIVQSYFPKSFGQILVPLAVELRLLSPRYRELQVTQARLRLEEVGSHSLYTLTVKGRTDSLHPSERVELPVSLERETYEALVPYASGGTVTKDRFMLPLDQEECDEIGEEVGEHLEGLTLEVDLPESRYGNGTEVQSLRELNIAFVEIELPSRALEERLCEGSHKIPVIRRSLDISKDQVEHEKYRKVLSWSRLARKGLSDAKLQRAISELQGLL